MNAGAASSKLELNETRWTLVATTELRGSVKKKR